MINPSVLCFGELLIDMISTTTGDLIASEGFLKKFGGAPANTAIGLAKLGIPVAFMGKVGNDPFGQYLKLILDEYHVDTRALLFSKKHHTTLAFVSLKQNGERHFSFYRGAHETISENDVSLPSNIKLFHFGSLTQTREQCNKATMKLIAEANQQDVIISYDPNIRESLWTNLTRAKTVILDTAKKVDILKLNEEEAFLLSNKQTIKEAASTLYFPNLDALFITCAVKGCYYKTKSSEGPIAAISVKAVDTTGAGDAFNAGYIYARITTQKKFSDMTKEEIASHLKRATIIASLTTTKKGAITAFPTPQEIKSALKQTS